MAAGDPFAVHLPVRLSEGSHELPPGRVGSMSVPAVEMRTMASLVETAESVRVETTTTLDSKAQARLGQFFTPAKAATLIASLPALPAQGTLRVLDPGAGSGMLTAALVERVAAEAPGMRIEVTAVELDETLLPALEKTARRCEVWARERGVSCTVKVLHHDLIEVTTGSALRTRARDRSALEQASNGRSWCRLQPHRCSCVPSPTVSHQF